MSIEELLGEFSYWGDAPEAVIKYKKRRSPSALWFPDKKEIKKKMTLLNQTLHDSTLFESLPLKMQKSLRAYLYKDEQKFKKLTISEFLDEITEHKLKITPDVGNKSILKFKKLLKELNLPALKA